MSKNGNGYMSTMIMIVMIVVMMMVVAMTIAMTTKYNGAFCTLL